MDTEDGGKNKQKFKIIMFGASGVGKTALVNQWVNNEVKEFIPSTIGATWLQKVIDLDGRTLKVQVWDTAGQERYRSIAPVYARNALGALVVFDITCQSSFKEVKDWVSCARKVGDFPINIVGNKADMLDERVVELSEGMALAEELGVKYWETSALTGQNVDEAFTHLVSEAVEYQNSVSMESRSETVNISTTKSGGGRRCC